MTRMNTNKLIAKYKSISQPAKASIWFVFSSVVNKGISFITTPFFTRILSTSEYGVSNLYNTWLTIFTIFGTLELATGVFNKAMIKYEDDRDGYTSSSLILTSLITGFLFIVYFIGRNTWNKLIGLNTSLMTMMFIEIFISSAWSFFLIRKRFDYHYKAIVIITIVTNILATLVSLYFTSNSTENRVEAKVFGLLLVRAIVYAAVYVYLLVKGKEFINISYWTYSLKYNLPLIPHYISQQVLNQADRIMISRMNGNSYAGMYSLAYQVAVIMQLLTNSIHASFMPWTFQCIKEGNLKKIGKRALQLEIMIGICCVLFSLFAPEVISILGTEEYLSAMYVVPPVSMSILFLTIYSFFGNIEFYYEETGFIMIASVVVAIENVVLNYICIKMFGYIAAGYTTLFCYMGYSLIHYLFMKKICKKNNIENPFDGKMMWGIAILFAAVSIGIAFIYKFTVIRYGCILLFGIFFAIYSIRICHETNTSFWTGRMI